MMNKNKFLSKPTFSMNQLAIFLEEHKNNRKVVTMFLDFGVKLQGIIADYDNEYIRMNYLSHNPETVMIVAVNKICTFTNKEAPQNTDRGVFS